MKIGFTGAGGTGKTTTAKLLAGMSGLPFIPSPSRAVFEKRGVKTEDDQRNLSPEGRLLLQMDIFEAITQQTKEYKSGIFDRTNLDNLFYGFLQCSDVLLDIEVERMYSTTVEMLRTFDVLIYVPIYDWKPPSDGMRTESTASRLLASSFIHSFLYRNDIAHFICSNHTASTRAELLFDKIKGANKDMTPFEVAFAGAR